MAIKDYLSAVGLVSLLSGFGTCAYQEVKMPINMSYNNKPEVTQEFHDRTEKQFFSLLFTGLGAGLLYYGMKRKE